MRIKREIKLSAGLLPKIAERLYPNMLPRSAKPKLHRKCKGLVSWHIEELQRFSKILANLSKELTEDAKDLYDESMNIQHELKRKNEKAIA